MKKVGLRLAQVVAYVLLIPFFLWFLLPLSELSRFTAPSQLLALIPGHLGIMLRRVWYSRTLRRCGSHFTVDWLAVVRIRDSEFGNHCTLGVGCWVGLARFGNDVMLGPHVIITSGKAQHGFSDSSIPARLQAGIKNRVTIADDVWVGARAVIMADVAPGTIVGAGSVVTKQLKPNSVIAGVPARVIRIRSYPSA